MRNKKKTPLCSRFVMMHYKSILYFFVFLWSVLYSNEDIRIHLATDNALEPIYINALAVKGSGFSDNHIKALEAILVYDFNYNGKTAVCRSSLEKDKLLLESDPSSASGIYKQLGAPYIVKWQIVQKTLRASLLNCRNGSLKTFSGICLSGDLGEDRRQIHKLADSIYKILFNKPGIAYSRILFAYQTKNSRADDRWVSEIWQCDWDGANMQQITHENSYCVSPVLFPSSDKQASDQFLYVSYKQGQPKIYIASLKETIGRRLIALKGNQLLPAISQGHDKIAFICDADGRTDLFMQPFDPLTKEMGKPVQLFSYPRATQASPTFSPDGSQIAFVSDKDSGTRIYVISTASSKKRSQAVMITKQNRENSCPAWSPDGTKLAYSAKTNGVRQIWIYDFESREERQLTSGPGNKENPFWAQDSMHLVFNSTDKEISELYIANLYQPEAIQISHGPGKKHYPTWENIGRKI